MATKLSSIFVSIGAQVDDLNKALRGAERRLSRTADGFKAMGKRLTLGVTLPIAGVAAAAVKLAADFEDSMTKSTAIMGDLTDAMKNDMADAARAVALETTFSAKQAAEAYFFLASAGLDAAQSIAALPQVSKFAQAGNFDLARATDLVTDAQSALGLASKDAATNLAGMTRVSDVLVKANTLANASVEQFSESLTNKAGAALRILNKDIEEGAAVLAALADQGIKGAEAGTTLDIAFRELQRTALANKTANRDFFDTVFDGSGTMRNAADIVGDLEARFAGLSDEQRLAELTMLGFNFKSISAINNLLGLSDKIRDYESGLRKAAGTTDEVARKQLESLNAQLQLTTSAIVDVGIELGNLLLPAVRKFLAAIKGAMPTIKAWIESFKELSPNLQLAIILVPALAAAIGPLIFAAGALLIAIKAIALGLVALGGPVTLAIALSAALLIFWEDLVRIAEGVWLGLKLVIAAAVDSIVDTLRGWLDFLPFIGEGLDKLAEKTAEFRRKAADDLDAWREAATTAGEGVQKSVEKATDSAEKAAAGMPTLAAGLADVDVHARGAAGSVGELSRELEGLFGRLPTQEEILQRVNRTARELKAEIDLFGPTVEHAQRAIEAAKQAMIDLVVSGIDPADERVAVFAETIRTLQGELQRLREEEEAGIQSFAEFREALLEMVTEYQLSIEDVMQLGLDAIVAFSDGVGDAVGRAIVFGEDFAENFTKAMKNLAANVISSLISMAIQFLIFSALQALLARRMATSQVGAKAGENFANVYASVTAALPFPANVIAAPIVAAASTAVLKAGSFAFLAEGGIIDRPLFGIVGEAGPEAVIPLDRLGDFMPAGGDVVTVLEVDGFTLAEIVTRNQPGFLRRKVGGSL